MYFHIACGMMITGFALFLAYMGVLLYSNSLLSSLNRNHFRNSYPYNFYKDVSLLMRVLLYILFGISMLMTSVGLSFFFISFSTSFMYILAVVFPLSYLCLGISNYLSLKNYRSHLLLSATGFVLFSSFSALLGFAKIIPQALMLENDMSLWICIFVGVIGFILFIALFNPKLLSWAKMDKVEEDGKTYYIKPKYNFYAMYEWIYLFAMQIVVFLFILNIIITGSIQIA